MNRRGFLAAILAAAISPAVVRAANLMPVRALDSGLLLPGWSRVILRPHTSAAAAALGRFAVSQVIETRDTVIHLPPGVYDSIEARLDKDAALVLRRGGVYTINGDLTLYGGKIVSEAMPAYHNEMLNDR
jgi:hypothetical protein